MASSDPAKNILHEAQAEADTTAQERWAKMSAMPANDDDAFNAMLLDAIGEAPSPANYDDSVELRDERQEIFNDYLDTIPVFQRIVLVRHYGVFGDKGDPAETATMLGVSSAQYNELLLQAKVALKMRKNELFKEITVDAR